MAYLFFHDFTSYLMIIIIALIVFVILRKRPFTISSHWQTFFDGLEISASEFYDIIKEALQERQITDVAITQESFLEKHLFSAMRAYLRITKDEYVIYICSAPYGTGNFFSSWLCTTDETVINRLGIISKWLGKDRSRKSFYQMDTEEMFKLAVHASMIAAIDTLTEAKGIRGLTELEKQYKYVQ